MASARTATVKPDNRVAKEILMIEAMIPYTRSGILQMFPVGVKLDW